MLISSSKKVVENGEIIYTNWENVIEIRGENKTRNFEIPCSFVIALLSAVLVPKEEIVTSDVVIFFLFF